MFFQNDAKIELKPIDYNKIIENVSSHINNMLSVNQNNIQELKNTPYTSLKILTFFIAQSIAWAYHKDGDINSFKNYLNTMLNIGPFCVDFFSKKTSLYTQIHGFNNNFISNMFTSRDHNEDIAKTIMEIIAHINLFIKNSAMNVQASLNLYPDKSASPRRTRRPHRPVQ